MSFDLISRGKNLLKRTLCVYQLGARTDGMIPDKIFCYNVSLDTTIIFTCSIFGPKAHPIVLIRNKRERERDQINKLKGKKKTKKHFPNRGIGYVD